MNVIFRRRNCNVYAGWNIGLSCNEATRFFDAPCTKVRLARMTRRYAWLISINRAASSPTKAAYEACVISVRCSWAWKALRYEAHTEHNESAHDLIRPYVCYCLRCTSHSEYLQQPIDRKSWRLRQSYFGIWSLYHSHFRAGIYCIVN